MIHTSIGDGNAISLSNQMKLCCGWNSTSNGAVLRPLDCTHFLDTYRLFNVTKSKEA